MMVPFALTATGSGASYWSGIVLAMGAQCLDAQRGIGTRAAPSLRSCHQHHGLRDVAACAPRGLGTGVVFSERKPFSSEQDWFLSERDGFEQVPCQAQVS